MQDYSVTPLDIGQRVGGERLLLWLPMTITHVIDENSPLYNWKDLNQASQDFDATIVVWVSSPWGGGGLVPQEAGGGRGCTESPSDDLRGSNQQARTSAAPNRYSSFYKVFAGFTYSPSR